MSDRIADPASPVEHIAALERTFGDDPASEAFVDLARALLDLGRARRAQEVASVGLAVRPDHVEGRLLLAEALLALGRTRACTREAARVLAADAGEVRAMKLLGRALLADGHAEEAWVVLRRAREEAPADGEVRTELARAETALLHRREATDEPIHVREPDGSITDLEPEPATDRPGTCTRYIRAVAAPAAPADGASGVIIDDAYRNELDANDIALGPVEPLPRPPAPPPPAAPKARFAFVDDSSDEEPTAEGEPPHPATGGCTRESLSPGLAADPLAAGGAFSFDEDDDDEEATREMSSPGFLLPDADEAAAGEAPADEGFDPTGPTTTSPPPAPEDALAHDEPALRPRGAAPVAAPSLRPRDASVPPIAAPFTEAPARPFAEPSLHPHDASEPAGPASIEAPPIAEPVLRPHDASEPAGPASVEARPIAEPALRPRDASAVAAPRPVAQPTLPARPFAEPAPRPVIEPPAAPTGLDADWLSVEVELPDPAPREAAGEPATFGDEPTAVPVGDPAAPAPAVPPGRALDLPRFSWEEPTTALPSAAALVERDSILDPGLDAAHLEEPRSSTVPLSRRRPFGAESRSVPAAGASRARPTSDERPDRASALLRDEPATAETPIPGPRLAADSDPAVAIPSVETPAVRSVRSDPAVAIPSVEASTRRPVARAASDSGVRVPPPPRSEAALPDAPRVAPRRPPAPPPIPKARPAAADLLEIPLDPAEFADMPPAPSAPAAHEAPADLDRLPGPDPSGVSPRAGAPAKAVAPRAAEPPEAVARPAARRPAEASEGAARRPADPSEGATRRPAAKPARARGLAEPAARPEPARRAEPAERPAPVRPSPTAAGEPSPDYSTDYASYFDARDSEVKEITDELGALVEERAPAASPRAAAPPTMPAPIVVGRRGVRGAVRLALLGVSVLVLLLAVTSIWRYRGAASEVDRLMTDTRDGLADGNYGSRLVASERLGATLDVDPFARLGDVAARAVGQGGLAGRHRAAAAMKARVEAERVALFGEPARAEAAKSALTRAGDGDGDLPADAAIASALLALHEGRLADAEARLAVAVGEQGADVLYVQALVAQADGRREAAVDRARTAADRDPRHVGARKLLADLKAGRGDYLGALEGYDQILESLRPDHVDTRIARARLQILIPKREQEAVAHLKELLDPDAWKVSDAQKALIHDGIGLFYSNQGDFTSARTAYAAALEAAPDDPRFSTGLARLDIREFKLDEAEERLTRAAALDRSVERHHVDLARVRLLRGDAKGALAHLEKVRQPDADALLLRGRALLATDNARGAEEALNEALRLDAGLLDARIYLSLAAFVQGRRGLALGQLQAHRSSQASGEQRLEDRTLPFRAYGDALARDGDARAAAGEYQRAVDVSHADFLAHFGLCRLDADRLEARDALKRCRDALGVNPHFVPAAELLSTVAEAQEDAGAVAAALEPILRKKPEPPALVRRLARAYVALGRTDDATALAEGEAAGVDDPTKRYIRGLVAAQRGSIGAALPLLNGVADELGDDPWAQLAHADALMKAGKSDQAGGFYRRALKVGAGARAALGAAQAWLLQGEWKDALTAAEEAERLAKQGLAHRRLRAEALASQARAWLQSGGGGAPRAASLLDRAQRIEVDLPATLVALGQLAEVEGHTDDAVAHYTRATTVSPNDPEGFYWLGRVLRETSRGRDEGATALRKATQLDPEGRWGLRARRLLDRR